MYIYIYIYIYIYLYIYIYRLILDSHSNVFCDKNACILISMKKISSNLCFKPVCEFYMPIRNFTRN